jgi:hypothetical protein
MQPSPGWPSCIFAGAASSRRSASTVCTISRAVTPGCPLCGYSATPLPSAFRCTRRCRSSPSDQITAPELSATPTSLSASPRWSRRRCSFSTSSSMKRRPTLPAPMSRRETCRVVFAIDLDLTSIFDALAWPYSPLARGPYAQAAPQVAIQVHRPCHTGSEWQPATTELTWARHPHHRPRGGRRPRAATRISAALDGLQTRAQQGTRHAPLLGALTGCDL